MKSISLLSLFVSFILVIQIGCNNETSATSEGEKIYRAKCTRCHGIDGKKGKKGAKDLNLSTKSLEYRINQIKEGKDKMPSFSERLTEEQIAAVAKYTIEHFPQKSEVTLGD